MRARHPGLGGVEDQHEAGGEDWQREIFGELRAVWEGKPKQEAKPKQYAKREQEAKRKQPVPRELWPEALARRQAG